MIATVPPANIHTKSDIAAIVYHEDAIDSHFWMQNLSVIPELTTSAFWTRQRHFIELSRSANRAATFEEGWDGYDAPTPNDVALTNALEVLRSVRNSPLNPYSVLPSADGGIGISFRGRDNKRAILEFLNDNTSSYSLYGIGHPTETSDFNLSTELQAILKRLEAYL